MDSKELSPAMESKASLLNTSGTSSPETLHEALMDVFRPILQELDVCVETTRNSQQDLKRQIDLLADEIHMISGICEISPALEVYAKKMTTIKRRITVMHNIIQNVQDRLRKLEQSGSVKQLAVSNSVPVAADILSPAPETLVTENPILPETS